MKTETLPPGLGEFLRVVRETVVGMKADVRAAQATVDRVVADNTVLQAEITELRSAIAEHRSAPDAGELQRMVEDMVRSVEIPAPKDGADGKDADPAVIEAMVRAAVAEIPVPKDGKDVDPAEVEAMVKRAVAEIPPPEPGKDGERGADGKDADPAVVEALVNDAVARAVAAIPAPKDGQDGKDGERGADGIATREELESLVRDAVADVQVRSMADTFRGVFKAGERYERSAVVSWDGCAWLAVADTKSKPGTDDTWRMIAKRGRDGRDRT